jgi:copper homeostasis protein
MEYKLEICAGSLSSALAAQEGGADRIELCDNLYEGGTTPSFGMMKICKSLLAIPFFPIIRPRGGDFVYSDKEFEVMKQDVLCSLELGCEGIVFGILRSDGSIDTKRCSELVKIAGSMQLTFHRAFDRCSNRNRGLEELIELGFHRVLTSGGENFAEDAIPELTNLVEQAKNRISIMPGSGVTGNNLSNIAKATGALEFHTTAKKNNVLMPINHIQHDLDTQHLFETDVNKVRGMVHILNGLSAEFHH